MAVLKIKDQNGNWLEIPSGGTGIPSGGTTDQVLLKASDDDFNFKWGAPIPNIYFVNSAPTSSSPDGLYFVV